MRHQQSVVSILNGIQSDKRDNVMEDLPLQGVPSSNLKQLLIACARALAENKLDDFEILVAKARSVVSVTGDPIQRLGAYIVEGLVARKELSGTTIYRSLKCKEPAGKDLFSYMYILYEICPYLKFGYMAANGAIVEACRNEDRIHIIDFQIAQGTQWMTLLQALAARPGGAPTYVLQELMIQFHSTLGEMDWLQLPDGYQQFLRNSTLLLSFMQCQFCSGNHLGYA